MAEAIAASLPAQSATPTITAPVYEAIPSAMVKFIDVEADIPLTGVQLDGMVRVHRHHPYHRALRITGRA